MVKMDKLHFSFRTIDGYNKAFNYIVSEREAGKSTALWMEKVYPKFKHKKQTAIILRRNSVDITEKYINDIFKIIHKFTNDELRVRYNRGELKEGMVDIFVNEELFVRIISMSLPISRIKGGVVLNASDMFLDEFIVCRKFKEKYLADEAFKFKEIYKTFRRENPNMKAYFLGNPYSLFNPYFVDHNVKTSQLQRGKIIVGSNFAIQMYEICPELRAKILENDPLYQFDDAYSQYAFNGANIEDENIPVNEIKPENFKLQCIIKIYNKYIGIWRGAISGFFDKFYCNFITNTYSRTAFTFNFSDMVEGSVKYNNNDKYLFLNFKLSFERRLVEFESIECYYLIEEIYSNL